MTKKILIGLGLFLLASILGVVYIKNLFLPASNETKETDFLINKGSSVSLVGKKLERAGLIKSGVVFKYYVQVTGSTNKIQAGEFQLSPNLSLVQLVEKLKKGPKEIFVTIPEGLRREEIAAKFKLALNKDEAFAKEFLTLSTNKEGYLFPDSYLFPKEALATKIVDRMVTTFEKKVKDVSYKQLIIASLLERETFSDSEKPIVAGIIIKRLENDWPLQIDATLQFAIATQKLQESKTQKLEKYWEPIYSNDKEINSPFNTYKNLGLPPSPICNPGLTSIQAAISPEVSDYWYYIHDNDGKIHYAKDLDEHNSNIRKYLD